MKDRRTDHLLDLLEALCEDRITPAQMAELERAVLTDRAARRLYLDYIDLHGTLYWDAARGSTDEIDLAAIGFYDAGCGASPAEANEAVRLRAEPAAMLSTGSRRLQLAVTVTAIVACSIVALIAWNRPAGPGNQIAVPDGGNPAEDAQNKGGRERHLQPIVIANRKTPDPPAVTPQEDRGPIEQDNSSEQHVVAFIDEEIRSAWQAAGIEPSPRADDAEWLRRVYLDVIGRIPPAQVVEEFLADSSPRKRAEVIDRLLDDPAYVHNWTTIWANLLVGRSMERNVDRPALQRFLRNQFARNRPWSETVYELVAAEGAPEENGAASFLIAHVNNEAVPATAITARLFLGVQVQCTQCHDHPFNNQWKQNQFWELNSFFKQTELVRREERDPRTGKKETELALVSKGDGGPTFYETRSGLMKVAYPIFGGTKVDPEADVNRRRELARLMIEGDEPLVASALVNRLWEHFFGYGFTRPVDDMGPHNPPTHPQVLRRLTDEFVRSGYDVQQLIRWICSTEAYQLTSRYGETNRNDDPAAGEAPLFSRVYVKSMTAEQVYDSLLVATRADRAGRSNWDAVARQREEWLQQFVYAFHTEENDETTSFAGTIPQALMLMNGELVGEGLAPRSGTYLHEVLHGRGSEVEKIRKLSLAALSRHPSDKELAQIRKAIRERTTRAEDRPAALTEALQDVFWALLNSSEFVLVH